MLIFIFICTIQIHFIFKSFKKFANPLQTHFCFCRSVHYRCIGIGHFANARQHHDRSCIIAYIYNVQNFARDLHYRVNAISCVSTRPRIFAVQTQYHNICVYILYCIINIYIYVYKYILYD